jgi:catechol 2,3-dioxygenase-like lactoylglutathione lyase family enzyme
MVRVVGIDHISIRVSDFDKSRAFYSRLFAFMGFKVLDEYEDAIGWTNGKTRFWIGQADAEGRQHTHRIGNVGLHHYAFELPSVLRLRKSWRNLYGYPATKTDRSAMLPIS